MFADSVLVRGIYGVTAIVLCHLLAQWTGAGYDFDIIPPNQNLSDLPMTIAEWEGSDVPIKKGTTEVLGAEEFVNREYENAEGITAGVHLAYWASPEYVVDVAPHHPRVCYTGAGWEVLEVRRIEVDTEDGVVPLEFMLLKRHDHQVVTAHWYQMGDFRFTNRADARDVHRQLWGIPQWPPTLKVLVLTSAPSIDLARPTLEELASELFNWTSSF